MWKSQKSFHILLPVAVVLLISLMAACTGREAAGPEEPAGNAADGRAGSDMEPGTGDKNRVRVSIRLESPSLKAMGYSAGDLDTDPQARACRDSLIEEQEALVERIGELTGEPPDVVWNITLAANIISAYVRRQDIPLIESLDGVAAVTEEQLNEPQAGRPDVAGDLR